MDTHDHYEQLCALAASGQLPSDELEDFRSHVATCPNCKMLANDLIFLSAQGLSVAAGERLRSTVPFGMTERFVARARSEGIEINRAAASEAKRPLRPIRWAAVCAVTATVLIAALFAIRNAKSLPFIGQDKQKSAHLSSPSPVLHAELVHTEDARLQEQLTTTRAQLSSMSATVRAQRSELDAVSRTSSLLNSHLIETEQQAAALQTEKAERESRIKQIEGELEKSRSEKNTNEVALALQETELRDLRKQVADQADALEQQEALAARGSDVRDLVVARNLHIIDVHDRDGDGKSQRAFGRIFYSEGKSLTFYAYDLADQRKVDAKVSFYVWGERLGAEKPVRSLGIFHSDDASDGRWVLTFDDPRVLTQIDSVFVTAESSRKAAREPRGQRILFAFLGGKPNHP